MLVINNILKTRDRENAVLISTSIETKGILTINSDGISIRLMSDSRATVAEYADKVLRSVRTLYGKPIIKCKYESYDLACLRMYSANICIEERENI